MVMERHPDVRVTRSELVVSGRVFDVRREHVVLPSGLAQELLVVDHPGAVAVAPILADGRVVLVRQYRHAIGDWLVEIPAGRLERGEDPATAARRELEEETGYRCGRLVPLGSLFPAAGFCSERIHLFAAEELSEVGDGRAPMDSDEEFEVLKMPLDHALEAVANDAKSWIALRRWRSRGTASAPAGNAIPSPGPAPSGPSRAVDETGGS
jgi:ADP-ribose pyrophosphatase